jgi:translation initiation factor IF-3
VVPTDEAQRMARDADMDLVEVAPNVRPPVCRIMDYGKWKYYQKKNIKKHHEQQMKEVRLRPKTDDHDRDIKLNRAMDFLKKGDKVQFTMVFRGRERSHREIGFDTFKEILAGLGDQVKVERPPSMDGRHMVMVVTPAKPGAPGAAPAAVAAVKHTPQAPSAAPKVAETRSTPVPAPALAPALAPAVPPTPAANLSASP